MATITPQAPQDVKPDAPPPQRWWIGLLAALILILVGGAVWLWWPGDEETPTTTPTTPATPQPTTAPSTTPATVAPVTEDAFTTLFFLGDHIQNTTVAGPHLIPVGRFVDVPVQATATDMVQASVTAIIDGVTSGDEATGLDLSSGIPGDTELLGVTIDGNEAVLDFNEAFASGGGTFTMGARLAQIVYTATAVPGIDSVLFAIDGEPVEVFSSEGIVLDGPQTRGDWTEFLPLVMVETPVPGAELESPILMEGIANAFEASVAYRLVSETGDVLAEGFTTASCGTGCFGEFSEMMLFTVDDATMATLDVFEYSANDGKPVNVYSVELTLLPGGEPAPVKPVPDGRNYDVAVADLPVEPIDGTVLVDATWGSEAGDIGLDPNGFGPCCFDVYDVDSIVMLDSANLRLVRFEPGAEPVVFYVFDDRGFVPDAMATIGDRVIVLGMTNWPNGPYDAMAISIAGGEQLGRVATAVPMKVDVRTTTEGVFWSEPSSTPKWTAIADSSGALLDPADQVTTDYLPGESTLEVAWDAGVEVVVQPAGDSLPTTYDVTAEDALFGEVLGYQRYADGALVVLGGEFDDDGRAAVRLLELGTALDNQLTANLYSFEMERWADTGSFGTIRWGFGALYVLNTTTDGVEIVRYEW